MLRSPILFLICGMAFAQPTVSDLLREKTLAEIRACDEKFGGVLGVVAIDLATGQTISYHGDVVFPQASSIKIPIMIQIFRAEREGKFRFSDAVTLTAKDVAEGGGLETQLKEGPVTLTISELVRRMIQNSDNTAANKCIEMAGMDRVNQTLDELGLRATRLRRKMMDVAAARRNDENVATPLEMARLMELIYRGKVIDEKASRQMLTILKLVNDDMRRAVPDSVEVASKPGELPGVRCETGVVFVPQRPFALSVASAYLPDLRSPVGDITRIVYTYFDKLGRSNRFGRGL